MTFVCASALAIVCSLSRIAEVSQLVVPKKICQVRQYSLL